MNPSGERGTPDIRRFVQQSPIKAPNLTKHRRPLALMDKVAEVRMRSRETTETDR